MTEEFYIPSAGKGNIYCAAWAPKAQLRGIVQIVHGIGDHISRYAEFAEYLSEQGFLVLGEDHMGHGKTWHEGEILGYFHGGWCAAVDDTYALMKMYREKYPRVPYILLGHSMGSFMARTLLYRHPDSGISGCVLSGTAWQPAPILKAGLALCRSVCRVNGETKPSAKLRALAFGSYNKQIPDAKTPNDWICSDPQVVEKYNADPMCGFNEAAGLDRDMLRGIQMNQKKDNIAKMRKDLPVLFVAGSCDPVGNNGKGVRQSAEAFRKAGMRLVDVKLYRSSRHEILNDVEKLQVFQDIYGWIIEKT